MSDRVELRGLRLLVTVGVLDHERTGPQPVEVDLDVACDLAAAAASDDLADTVDYGTLCDAVAAVAGARPYLLLEALAGAIADVVLGTDGVSGVEVTVRKLRPPVAQQLATSGVRLVRTRS